MLGVVIFIIVGIYYFNNKYESFFGLEQKAEIHPDLNFQKFLTGLNEVKSETPNENLSPINLNSENIENNSEKDERENIDFSKYVLKSSMIPKPNGPDMSQFIRRTDVERVAGAAASRACPVKRGYDPNDYIKKSEIPPPNSNCPPVPDLKDFVLKSTIPPTQQCPPCVCPKVKVSAGLCKKQFPQKFTCPPPKPCGTDECRKIVKCLPGTYPIPPKPECPKVLPCPKPPSLMCPPCRVPSVPRCPPPKPCPVPNPCPNPTRCPPGNCPKCRYYGVKKVCDKPLEELVQEMINSGNISKLQNISQMLTSSPIDNQNEPKKNI